jgi:hypothetical protein
MSNTRSPTMKIHPSVVTPAMVLGSAGESSRTPRAGRGADARACGKPESRGGKRPRGRGVASARHGG